jgi:hypothetical protein
MGRIVAETTVAGLSEREYQLAVVRQLGQAGAKAGADAVIVEDRQFRLPLVVVQGNRMSSVSPQRRVEFEGEAVGWIDGTCKRRALR